MSQIPKAYLSVIGVVRSNLFVPVAIGPEVVDIGAESQDRQAGLRAEDSNTYYYYEVLAARSTNEAVHQLPEWDGKYVDRKERQTPTAEEIEEILAKGRAAFARREEWVEEELERRSRELEAIEKFIRTESEKEKILENQENGTK